MFAQSLTDLISLLNTGVVQDQQVTKRRADLTTQSGERILVRFITRYVSYEPITSATSSSGDHESHCTCNFNNRSFYREFEGNKQAIIDQLKSILDDAGLPTLRGVYA